MSTQTAERLIAQAPKKKLVRRLLQDRTQGIRHLVQGSFVVLNAWLGAQFYLWVRYFERGGQGLYVPRPAGVEGWLPIAGLMNTKYFLTTGHVPVIHPAAMFLFIAFVLISLLLKGASDQVPKPRQFRLMKQVERERDAPDNLCLSAEL